MKVSIIGAGYVRATAALMCAQKKVGEVVLLDIIEGMPAGKGLDIAEAGPVAGFGSKIKGTNSFEDIRQSKVVVVTSGLPRKPGMTRMDLLAKNAAIVADVTRQIVEYAPDSIILMVTNPLDVMCYVAWKVSGFSEQRVLGMAGVLDSTRFRCFVAEALDISVEDTQAMVLGGHGDSMVPLPRYTTAAGIPITQLLPKERVDELVERTRKGGTEIVNLLKTGSAYYAPGAAAAQMVEAILFDKRRLLPASAYLMGEYDLAGVYMGVPVILGRRGVEEIVEIELTLDEREALKKSALDVKEGIEMWENLQKKGNA